MEKVMVGKFSVGPHRTVIAGVIINGKPNYSTLASFGGLSVDPPIVYISINKAHYSGSFIKENDHLLKNAEISFTHEKGFPCNIDQESFDILLKNLFENAIRYSPTPASIAVSLKRVDHKVLLTVRDKGEGLEKKELSKIFEMFYRVPRKLRGTGLGLYIVKNIVSAHHGKIWAESEGPGKGSCFHVLLPALKNSMG